MERYFSDSLLGRGVSLWYIHKKESILEGADADQHADPVENQHELHMGKICEPGKRDHEKAEKAGTKAV